jgi:hypothetical protein
MRKTMTKKQKNTENMSKKAGEKSRDTVSRHQPCKANPHGIKNPNQKGVASPVGKQELLMRALPVPNHPPDCAYQ